MFLRCTQKSLLLRVFNCIVEKSEAAYRENIIYLTVATRSHGHHSTSDACRLPLAPLHCSLFYQAHYHLQAYFFAEFSQASILYLGLTQVTNWVKFKLAAMSLKKLAM